MPELATYRERIAAARDFADDASLEYEEVVSQPYLDCSFSAGIVLGHPIDTLYIKLERPPEKPTIILLRPDEAAAIVHCLGGALWSRALGDLLAEIGESKDG